MRTRTEIARYAQRTCIAALEQAANRRISGAAPEVIDHVGYVPTMLEEALRPFWGLAPLLRDGVALRMRVGNRSVAVTDWLRDVLISGVTRFIGMPPATQPVHLCSIFRILPRWPG